MPQLLESRGVRFRKNYMHLFTGLLAGILFVNTYAGWETDMEKAKVKAVQEHKLILLNFSGSDWCGPCIRLHDEVFESREFKQFAESGVILVNADFPRMKKNQLPKEQQKQNDFLAEKYDANGVFPYTVLLDAQGNVVKAWEGFPQASPAQFVGQLKNLCDARK